MQETIESAIDLFEQVDSLVETFLDKMDKVEAIKLDLDRMCQVISKSLIKSIQR